jgi:hypothetical protein
MLPDAHSESEIAESWIAAQEASDHGSWAIQAVINLAYRDPELCWDIVERIHAKRISDSVRSSLAAGPIEDLLVFHPLQFFPRVKALAARDETFKSMLTHVWLDGNDSPIWQEFYELAGANPPFPPGWDKP